MTKAILRRYLLRTSETHPDGDALFFCLSSEVQKDDRSSAVASSARKEDVLQGWFDPLDIHFDAAARTLFVRFPHVFFGLRFMKLFRPELEHAAEQVWGENLTILYATGNGPFEHCVQETDAEPQQESRLSSLAAQNALLAFVRPSLPAHAARKETISETFCEEESDVSTKPGAFEKQAHAQPVLFATRRGTHSINGNTVPYGEDCTFDTFIANGKHKWAVSLAREVVRKAVHATQVGLPSQSGEAPGILVLCGPHGTGKTHLLRAMGNEMFQTFGEDLLCASLSELELLFASAPPLAVRRELTEKRAILLDDFQYLSSIPEYIGQTEHPEEQGVRFQEELCLILDRFMDQGKPFVVAGVGHPRDWNLHRALQSRLETGLWTELPEPDLDVRLRYVQQQTRLKRLSLPREHMLLLAQHCSDIRRLSGVIRRVVSHRSLVGRDLAEQDILNIIRQSGDSSSLTAQRIVSIVGEHCGVPPRDILGEKRRPDLVQARQLAMYLCRELLGHSYPVIGRMFGGKDHSTVMHGVKKIKLLQESDRITHTMVTELTKACLERRD